MLGINPGRFGAGITGIPFTDPVALGEQLGIANAFERQKEMSCSFVYEFINAFGGPKKFYSRFLLSGVCPLGLLNGTKNCNYYDSPKLLRATRLLIHESLTKHAAMNVRTDVVISLGKKNATHLEKINDELHLFKQIVTLDHPRYIMQYRLRSMPDYILQYTRLLESLL